MRATLLNVSRVLLLAGLVTAPASAEVVRIDVQSRSDLVGGQAFASGSYEKIAGKILFAVDPALPANRIVADLDIATRMITSGWSPARRRPWSIRVSC